MRVELGGLLLMFFFFVREIRNGFKVIMTYESGELPACADYKLGLLGECAGWGVVCLVHFCDCK